MKNYIKSIFTKQRILIFFTLIIGLVLGRLFFSSDNENHNHDSKTATAEQETIYTCSMHPQIKQNKPGLCPICAMELIPLISTGDATTNPNAITLTDAAIQLASIQTSRVLLGSPQKTLHLTGTITADERNTARITARYPGRIEQLMISYTGQEVKQGQRLASIYSPALITAQKELIEALDIKEQQPALYHAARNKLKLWNLTQQQIDIIEQRKTPLMQLDILSPISGTVTIRNIAVGDYVQEGSLLLEVMDLTQVWALFDLYERDMAGVHAGDTITFTLQAIPQKIFSGPVTYIDPLINSQTRVARARVELDNKNGLLKPQMFANGTLISLPQKGASKQLMIPKTALLWTGKRSVVYIQDPNQKAPTFNYREITLGGETDQHYIITSGLSEGEIVATHGVFKIDAAAQLEGKTSMMNREGKTSAPPHHHTNVHTSHATPVNHHQEEKVITQKSFRVSGNCGMCKSTIENAAQSLHGVQRATWDQEEKTILVDFDPQIITLIKIHEAIAQSGYDTDQVTAPDSVYKTLPQCCLYRQ